MNGSHLVLIGLMGVGKTTVGKVLAERLGRQLVDSDLRIEARAGRTVKQILDEDGLAEMRPIELLMVKMVDAVEKMAMVFVIVVVALIMTVVE